MLNYSFVNKNETKPYNMGNVENSSHLETAVVILNVPLMFASITGNALVLAAILKTPSLRFVHYRRISFYAVSLLQIFLWGLLFNLFTSLGN